MYLNFEMRKCFWTPCRPIRPTCLLHSVDDMTEGQLAVNDGITRVFILIVYVSIALESNGAFMEKTVLP